MNDNFISAYPRQKMFVILLYSNCSTTLVLVFSLTLVIVNYQLNYITKHTLKFEALLHCLVFERIHMK